MLQRYAHWQMTRLTSARYKRIHDNFHKWNERTNKVYSKKNPSKISVRIVTYMHTIYMCILAWFLAESETLSILHPDVTSGKITELAKYSRELTQDQLVGIQDRYLAEVKETIGLNTGE